MVFSAYVRLTVDKMIGKYISNKCLECDGKRISIKGTTTFNLAVKCVNM